MSIVSKLTNLALIHSALRYIPSDDRDIWIRVGMAIKSELGDSGFAIWDNWSKTSDRYNERDARATWKSFKPGGGITIGTLFYFARQNGWQHHSQTKHAKKKRSPARTSQLLKNGVPTTAAESA